MHCGCNLYAEGLHLDTPKMFKIQKCRFKYHVDVKLIIIPFLSEKHIGCSMHIHYAIIYILMFGKY